MSQPPTPPSRPGVPIPPPEPPGPGGPEVPDPATAAADPATAASRTPLSRAPGDRYRASSPAAGAEPRGGWRRLALAALAALAGGLVTCVLGNIDIGLGLLAIGAATGWLTGLALTGGASAGTGPDAGPVRAATAALLAATGVLLGMLADGVWALAQGGVLTPVAYVGEAFGGLAALTMLAAAAAGALRAR